MKTLWISTLAILAASCGTEQPAVPGFDSGTEVDADTSGPPRYLPLAVGATWTYHETDVVTGETGDRTTTVEAYEDVGPSHPGARSFRVRVEKLDATTVYWEGHQGDLTVRYRSDDYALDGHLVDRAINAPRRMKLDESAEHLVQGASYVLTWLETTIDITGTSSSEPRTERWDVISTSERVTVPAGSFDDALHIRRTNTESSRQKYKEYWYVRGIGKVKELGGGQTEELIAYTTPGKP